MALIAALLLSQADFETLDRLDPLDTSELPFVKVATGRWFRYDDDPPSNTYRFGFLLKDEGGAFTVRFADLTSGTLKPTAAGTSEHERVGYEKTDLAAHAAEFVAGLPERRHFYVAPDATVDYPGQALLLARACARRGLAKELDVLRAAAGERGLEEVAEGAARHLQIEFGELPREALIARHRLWLELFPKHRYAEWVRPRLDHLNRMVSQKRPEGEIAGLIFDLRDEVAPVEESGVDGWALSDPPKGPRPSKRLEELGHAAVPALLGTIGDETPTRAVRYHSRYGGSFWIYDAGDFAEAVLSRISGLRVYGKTEERAAKWRAWWKTVGEKGEAEALGEIAASGDSGSEDAARRLVEKWPERVGDVLRGARKASNRNWRARLIEIAVQVKATEVDAFLIEELEKGPYVGARVEAARALLDRGDRRGLDVFKGEWRDAENPKQKPEPDVPEAVRDFDVAIARGEARQAMATFLLESGDLDAVRAVGADLKGGLRGAVLDSLGDLEDLLKRAKPDAKAPLEREFERILGSLLDDEIRMSGLYGSVHDPLRAELAALRLQRFWPKVYAYDPKGPTRLRERRLIAVKNIFRARFGMETLPLPAAPAPPAKDPALAKAVETLDLPALEAAGLNALPWIQEKPELAGLARRLSNLVGEATLETGGWEAPKELKDKVAALKGKPFDPETAIALLTRAMGSLPTRTGDVELHVDRLGDGRGTWFRLRAVPKAGGDGESVGARLSVQADGRSLEGSYGSGSWGAYGTPDRYADTLKAMRKALTTPHTGTFEFRIELEIR